MAHSEDKRQIRGVIAKWLRATREGDLDTVLGLMAKDVVFLTSGNPPMRGRKAFAAATKAALKMGRIEGKADIQEITVVGKRAFCWNHLSVTLKPRKGGKGITRKGHVLSVFRKKRSGRWVIWRDANLLGG